MRADTTNDTEMDHKDIGSKIRPGLIQIKICSCGGLLWTRQRKFNFRKRQKFSWPTREL